MKRSTLPGRAADADEFSEFDVTFLTETISLDPADQRPARQKGLVTYHVWAKSAEDAILRLRESEPIEHPIVEIASVVATNRLSAFTILPREWSVGVAPLHGLVSKDN